MSYYILSSCTQGADNGGVRSSEAQCAGIRAHAIQPVSTVHSCTVSTVRAAVL